MEEDVSRAIKQLESIAIKAMKSGYLDDAAKVMHIAEEIERVDKSGVAPGKGSDPEALADSDSGSRADDSSTNVVPLNRLRIVRTSPFGESMESQERS